MIPYSFWPMKVSLLFSSLSSYKSLCHMFVINRNLVQEEDDCSGAQSAISKWESAQLLRMLWSSEAITQTAAVEIVVIKARSLSTVPVP